VSSRLVRGTLVAAALLVPAAPLQLYFAGNWYSLLHSYSLGMFFGILSYTWFCLTLVLAARLRILDRLIGHDRVLWFHGWLAAGAVGCAAAHAVFKLVSYGVEGLLSLQVCLGMAGSALFDTVAAATVLFMIGGVARHIGLVARIREHALRRWRFDYSGLKLFHNLTAVALALVAVHVLMAAPTAENGWRMGAMGGMGGAAVLVYVLHKVVRYAVRRRAALRITHVSTPGPQLTELCAEFSRGGISRHRAGQFGYVRVLSDACGIEEHPFTVSSKPGEPGVSFIVKALGDYTARLAGVRPGERLMFDGPYGTFTPDGKAGRYLFIAGGIGITPFLSIVSDWDTAGFPAPTALLWSVRTRADLADNGLFENAARRHPQFSYAPVITGEPGSLRIGPDLLRTHLGDSPSTTEAYVCGPLSLRQAVVEALRGLGVPRRHIHYEAFSV